MNNKKKGSSFEKEWATILRRLGRFAHEMDSKTGAQPFDVISCKKKKATGYECKTVKGYEFDLKRVENNQYYTIKKHYDNIPVIFVFKCDNGEKFIMSGKKIVNLIDNDFKKIDVRSGRKCNL